MAKPLLRKRHMGYDTYYGGPLDSLGWTKCVLRPRCIPTYIDYGLRNALPAQLMWPGRDYLSANGMIDAIYSLDVERLVGWLSEYPRHTFGYENTFLDFARHRNSKLSVDDSGDMTKEDLVASLQAPEGKVVRRSRLLDTDLVVSGATLQIRVEAIYYSDGDAWLHAIVSSGGNILSKCLIDPSSHRVLPVKHRVGLYRALGVDPDSVLGLLGAKVTKRVEGVERLPTLSRDDCPTA